VRFLIVQKISLFTLFGLKVTISVFGIVSFLIAVPPIAWLAARPLRVRLTLTQAVLAGTLSAIAMFVFEFIHQWGHAWAAKGVGYPMTGIHWHSWFSSGIYPADGPPLLPSVHIRRALGGFWINVLLGLLLAPPAFYLWPRGGVVAWVIAFTSVWNFFVLGLGALAPIDIPGVFTIDGGTILHYWREIRRTRMNTDKR
jgi:hypothetical protein